MQVHATVQLDEGEVLTVDPDVAAEAVLLALGADLVDDHCVLSVVSFPQRGSAGTEPLPPPSSDIESGFISFQEAHKLEKDKLEKSLKTG